MDPGYGIYAFYVISRHAFLPHQFIKQLSIAGERVSDIHNLEEEDFILLQVSKVSVYVQQVSKIKHHGVGKLLNSCI